MKKLNYHELAKHDPNFHDIRAKILLEASHSILQHAREVPADLTSGVTEASVELRRMASNARRAHKKLQDERREQARGSDARARAFGFQ